MGQAENKKDRLSFCPAKSNDLCEVLPLVQQSRMPRAIAVCPNAHGGYRFSHHWQRSFAAPATEEKHWTASLSCESTG
jgi:hypothetical protein